MIDYSDFTVLSELNLYLMCSTVCEDRYLAVRKLITVAEDLDALVCTAEALRLCDVDVVNSKTAVNCYIKFCIVVS